MYVYGETNEHHMEIMELYDISCMLGTTTVSSSWGTIATANDYFKLGLKSRMCRRGTFVLIGKTVIVGNTLIGMIIGGILWCR